MTTTTQERGRFTPQDAPADAPAITREGLREHKPGFPGKLLKNKKTITDAEFNAKHGLDYGVLRWYQEIQDLAAVEADGSPALRINHEWLQTMAGDPVSEKSWVGMLSDAYNEVCGCSMLPDDPEAAAYKDHCFWFKPVKTGENQTTGKEYFSYAPTEYLGADYKYEGRVRVLKPRDGPSGGRAAQAEAAAAETADDTLLAEYLAFLDGKDVASLTPASPNQAPNKDKLTGNLYGVSVRGGLAKGATGKQKIIDVLVEKGHIEVAEDGTIVVIEG